MAVVLAIDPGTVTGFVAFNTETRDISMIELFEAGHAEYDDRIRWLAAGVKDCFDQYDVIDLICIETFVMRGKGGQQLQKLIGAYISVTPDSVPVRHVFNTTVKKLVGGKGSDDKATVANGVQGYFKSNKASELKIRKLIEKEKWDLTDAFAIGIAGWSQYESER